MDFDCTRTVSRFLRKWSERGVRKDDKNTHYMAELGEQELCEISDEVPHGGVQGGPPICDPGHLVVLELRSASAR